jgi:hypothetical protein
LKTKQSALTSVPTKNQHSGSGYISESPKVEESEIVAPPSSPEIEFNCFFEVYPKAENDGRLSARRAFHQARLVASFEEIMAGARRYAKLRSGQNTKFSMRAVNWLKEGRWGDEAVQAVRTAPWKPFVATNDGVRVSPLEDRKKQVEAALRRLRGGEAGGGTAAPLADPLEESDRLRASVQPLASFRREEEA